MPSANISDSVAKSFDKTDWTFLYHGLNVFQENVGSLQKSRAEFEMHVLRDASPYWSSTIFPEIMIVVLGYTVTCQQLVVAIMMAACMSLPLHEAQVFLFPVNPGFAMPRVSSVPQCYPVLGCWGSAWWPELTESCGIYVGRRRLHRRFDITDLSSSICIDPTAAWSACVIKAVIAFLSIMTISTRTSQMLPEVRRGPRPFHLLPVASVTWHSPSPQVWSGWSSLKLFARCFSSLWSCWTFWLKWYSTHGEPSCRPASEKFHILLNQWSSIVIIIILDIIYVLSILNASLSILFSILLPHDVFYIFTMLVELVVGESPSTLLGLWKNKTEINPMGGWKGKDVLIWGDLDILPRVSRIISDHNCVE